MQEEKELIAQIQASDRGAKAQKTRLANDLGGAMYDQSMSKRRADSEGEAEEMNKKSRAQLGEGGIAYDSHAIRTLQDDGYGGNRFGDETGAIGDKEPRSEQGETREKGGTREKEKEKGNMRAIANGKRYFQAPDHDDPLVKMQTQMDICKLKAERGISMDVSMERFKEMLGKLVSAKGSENTGGNRMIADDAAKRPSYCTYNHGSHEATLENTSK